MSFFKLGYLIFNNFNMKKIHLYNFDRNNKEFTVRNLINAKILKKTSSCSPIANRVLMKTILRRGKNQKILLMPIFKCKDSFEH